MLLEQLAGVERVRDWSPVVPYSRAVVYGAGGRGESIAARLGAAGVEVTAFADSDPARRGTSHCGLPVLGPADLPGRAEPVVVASLWYAEIAQTLDTLGVDYAFDWQLFPMHGGRELIEADHERITAVLDALADDASRRTYLHALKAWYEDDPGYFAESPHPIYRPPEAAPAPGGIIVDGRAYDGDSALDFLKDYPLCPVHAFEPFPRTFDTLAANLGRAMADGRAVAVCKGLGDRAARLRFNTRHLKSSAYRLQDDGDTEVEVVDIDGHAAANGLRVSLIKLDVEGGEPEALLGAAKTIAAQRPVLHVSLYHRPSHLWELVELVQRLRPGSRLHVGQHSTHFVDTVLYAS
jgi:FkbM family methyltransferase